MPSVSILIIPMQMMIVTEPYFRYTYGLCVLLYIQVCTSSVDYGGTEQEKVVPARINLLNKVL